MTHVIKKGEFVVTFTASEVLEIYGAIIERKLDTPIIPFVSALANFVNQIRYEAQEVPA